MISYLTMAILIYFFAIEYKPYIATYRMFSEVVTNISEAIFFFDDNYKCIYVNRRAKELYERTGNRVESAESMNGAWEYAKSVLTNAEIDMDDIIREGYFQCVRNFDFSGEKLTYSIEYQKVLDKKDRLAGSFLTVKDRTEEQRRLDKERYQATHDSLTGLFNADYMFTRIEKMLMENPDQRYVVVTSDIKGFKMVNDIYGRKTGDEILINLANQIRERASEDTIYGRIGGDKFGLIMNRKNFDEHIFEDGVRRVKSDMDKERDMFYPIIIHVGVYEVFLHDTVLHYIMIGRRDAL
jgi:diguanylate cyclase (GGDEF)-like protein